MSNADFAWQPLLHTGAPPASKLQAALFTTYDRTDERLLAEHLLPLLLKLGREPDGEGAERQYFLLELDKCLKQLHDRLVVVSSTVREEPGDAEEGESGTYGWIWRSIRHLTVGRGGKAVQHAKLWMLHWGPDTDGGEHLEIVVSSANLTLAAFKGQLQAAWRTCIKLRPKPSEERRRSWGVLPDFLRELAASAGEDRRLDRFVELLARGECPDGVTFVASVPGRHSRQELHGTPWGAAGLRAIRPAGGVTVSAAILCPFVGSWTADALHRWCASFEGLPDRLALVWLDENHPWAKEWVLPEATLEALVGAGANLLQLRQDPADGKNPGPFHSEHRSADERWAHAKAYSFRRGASRRVLVTSANFSPAAWGRQNDEGELVIENFELGVCVEQAAWPFDGLETFDNPHDAAAVAELPARGAALITWAQAAWDGNKVDVKCRCEAGHDFDGALRCGGEWIPIANWTADADNPIRLAMVPWTDSERPPMSVRLWCGDEVVTVPVFDERPPLDMMSSLPPEVDEDAARWMRDQLLFEQYGGRVADDAEGEAPTASDDQFNEDDEGDGPSRTDSYAVKAFEIARQHFGVVDNWARQVKCAAARGTEDFERRLLLRDGELLIDAFQRQADRDGKTESARAIGAKLAAEELTLRLKHFMEA